jgi:hypothetical protein
LLKKYGRSGSRHNGGHTPVLPLILLILFRQNIPCAMALRLISCSPVTGLFCHRRLAENSTKLDASVAAPGPHDFVVRTGAARLATPSRVHRIPPHVRDDAYAPLVGAGRRQASIISDFQKEEFSARGSGNAKAHDSAHEIGFCAPAVARRFQPDARREFEKNDRSESP